MNFTLTHKTQIFKPGLFGESHASTLLRQPDGSYLAAWFAGTKEGADNVCIYGALRDKTGKWHPPAQWAKISPVPHWNPVLFAPQPGVAMLFFKTGTRCDCWQTWITKSLDGGRSWAAPTELVPQNIGGRGPVKNKPMIISDGSWLAPNSLEDGGQWRVLTDRSTDGGLTWHTSLEVPMDRTVITGQGAIQPTLWESSPGHVHMLTRSSCGFICRSDSSDYGRTWGELKPIALPNNNSGLDLDISPQKYLLLAYNKVSENWGPRTPLNLAGSANNGLTWQELYALETAPGEYAYPAVIATPEGFAGTYTWKRDSIVFWTGCLEK